MTAIAAIGDAPMIQGRAREGAPHPADRRVPLLMVSNALGSAVALSPSSHSISRTVVLRAFVGCSRLAVAAHGLGVVAIALVAGPWVAQVPQLTLGVVLTLVGLQMVGADMVSFWRAAYHPTSPPAQARAGLLFWAVLLTSVALCQVLWGFAAGLALWLLTRSARVIRIRGADLRQRSL